MAFKSKEYVHLDFLTYMRHTSQIDAKIQGAVQTNVRKSNKEVVTVLLR